MKAKLWLFLIIIGFAFAACEKDDELKGPPAHAQAKGNITANLNNGGDNNNGIEDGVTPLIAGQHYEVGTVTVQFDGDYILVTYDITEAGWYITETHLHVSIDKEGIPTNNPGNPMIGLFEYSGEHDKVLTFRYEILRTDIDPDLDYECYAFAAHAVVATGEGDVSGLDDFNALFPEGPVEVQIANGPSAGNLAYFENVTISGGSFLDRTYDLGWCVQTGIRVANPGTATAYSSYDLPDPDDVFLVNYPENFDKVNWLLNNISASDFCHELEEDITMGDIQMAIWALIDGGEPDGYQYVTPYSPEMVDKLVEKAEAKGTGFKPDCGELVVIVLDYGADDQNIIVGYPLPCYQEETAWGAGDTFVDRGNWAMYFNACDN